MRNKCGVFAADTQVECGAFMIQKASIKMYRSRCCDDAGKSPPLSVYPWVRRSGRMRCPHGMRA